jgi:DNA-binding beta-propeller fold protein YncE
MTLSPRFTRTLLAAVVAASGAFLPGAAATAATHPAPPTSSVVHLDLASGQMPENVVADRDGGVVVSFAAARQVARIDAYGKITVLATLPRPHDPAAVTPLLGFPLVTGLVRSGDTFYVLYATGSAEETGLWTFTEGGAPRKLADLPAGSMPNGLVRDEGTGAFYVTDSASGAVYTITARGRVSDFSRDPALAPTAFFGVNGAKIHDGRLYVSNTDTGTVLRTPLTGRHAGRFTVVATGLTGIDDFDFTGSGRIVAALVTQNKVVTQDGRALLTEADGLSNPTSILVRGQTTYVPSAAYTTQHDPNLLVVRVPGVRS